MKKSIFIVVALLFLIQSNAFAKTYFTSKTLGKDDSTAAADTNDGNDNLGFGLTNGSYTDTQTFVKTFTKTGAFASYTPQTGDYLYMSSVTGGWTMLGLILSKVNSDSVTFSVAESTGSLSTQTDVATSNGPYLTVGKAVTTIAGALGAAGDTVLIGDGDYSETAGGTTYWYITTTFTNGLSVTATNSGQVTIHGSSNGTNSIFLEAAQNITWTGIKFAATSGASKHIMQIYKACKNIKFISCTFTSATGNDKTCLFIWNNGTTMAYGINFYNCTFVHTSTKSTGAYAVQVDSTGYIAGLAFFNTTFTVSGTNATVIDASYNNPGVWLNHCTITHTNSNTYTLKFGADGGTTLGQCTGIVVEDSTINAASSHGVIFGAGSHGSEIRRCTITGGDYGVVIKTSFGQKIKDNIIKNQTTAGIISRGTFFAEISGNTIYNSRGGIDITTQTSGEYGIFGNGLRVVNNIIYPIYNSGNVNVISLTSTVPNAYIDGNVLYGTASGTVYPYSIDSVDYTFDDALSFWTTYGSELSRTSNDANSTFGTDPQFVDASNADFRPTNRAIVKGKNLFVSGTTQEQTRSKGVWMVSSGSADGFRR